MALVLCSHDATVDVDDDDDGVREEEEEVGNPDRNNRRETKVNVWHDFIPPRPAVALQGHTRPDKKTFHHQNYR